MSLKEIPVKNLLAELSIRKHDSWTKLNEALCELYELGVTFEDILEHVKNS